LKRADVPFNGAGDHDLDEADEAVIVALAATLHDVGRVVHRDNHAYYSIPLAADALDRLLAECYDTAGVVELKAEILHAILFDLLLRLQPWDSTRGGHPGDATPGGKFPLAGTPVRGHRIGPG
jgi:hypothetical protein